MYKRNLIIQTIVLKHFTGYLLCWDSTPAKGDEVLYNYVDCSCKKDIPLLGDLFLVLSTNLSF